MFGFIYRFAAALAIVAVLSLNSACFSSLVKGNERRANNQERNNRGNQTREENAERVNLPIPNNREVVNNDGNNVEETNGGNNAEETNAPANAEDASVLAGVWQTSYQFNGMPCGAEIVFQPNGGYSSLAQCNNGTYMIRLVGNWYFLQQNAVRIQYTDYSPKEYGGNPIRIPDGETVYFRVVNRNQIESSFGMLYRVQ